MIAADEPPSLPQHTSSPPPSKRPKRDPAVLTQMRGLLQTGVTSLGYVEGSTSGCPGGLWSHGAAMLLSRGR